MLTLPSVLQIKFEAYLRTKKIPENARLFFKKWLRYYLDFYQKYHSTPTQKESLSRFLCKLQEKKQTKQFSSSRRGLFSNTIERLASQQIVSLVSV